MSKAVRTLVLIGNATQPPEAIPSEQCVLVYWDRIEVPAGVLSLPTMVEKSSAALCAEYADWCSSLATVPIRKSTLARFLKSRLLAGGSFWWTTTIAARSPISSPGIYDVIKLRALERLYMTGQHGGLHCVGMDDLVEGILRGWCKSIGHQFTSIGSYPASRNAHTETKQRAKRQPHPLRALTQLGYFLRRRYLPTFKFWRKRPRPLKNSDLVVFTYFPNIELAQAEDGRFRSHYWGPLHGLIERMGLKVNWIWFYHESQQLSYQESVALSRKLNRDSALTGQQHMMLEDRLKWTSVLSALTAYFRLLMGSFRLESCREFFKFSDGKLNFFDVLEDEWYASLRGADAMVACLYSAAFRDTSADMPANSRMLYLWENQGWEQSLLCAWKDTHRAVAVAVAHTPSCTAPAHLRANLARDPVGRLHERRLPDRLVAFGRTSAQTLLKWGWPEAIITTAEALRYMQLGGKYGIEQHVLPEHGRHLLIVTGILRSEVEFQLRLLSSSSASGGLSNYSRVTIKPHPFCAVDELVRGLRFSLSPVIDNRSLDDLFHEADVVFASNSTSASVQAAWLGLPLILTVAFEGLNLNPLVGLEGVSFVATPDELSHQLAQPGKVQLPVDTYLLDKDLPRWRALLT